MQKDINTLIKDSFLELYKKHSIDEIKVSQIISLANIGRSTFYNYFKNVEDIINSIELEIDQGMVNIFNEYNYININDLPINTPAPNFYEVYKYIFKNKDFFICTLGDHGSYLYNKKMKINIKNNLNSIYAKYFIDNNRLNLFVNLVAEEIIKNCRIIINYNISAKTLSIITKKYIIDLINNKDLYFKN